MQFVHIAKQDLKEDGRGLIYDIFRLDEQGKRNGKPADLLRMAGLQLSRPVAYAADFPCSIIVQHSKTVNPEYGGSALQRNCKEEECQDIMRAQRFCAHSIRWKKALRSGVMDLMNVHISPCPFVNILMQSSIKSISAVVSGQNALLP